METGSVPRCNGSLWKNCWKEAAQSEDQGHRLVQKLLFVTSGPARGAQGQICPTKGLGVLCNERFVDSSWMLSPVG